MHSPKFYSLSQGYGEDTVKCAGCKRGMHRDYALLEAWTLVLSLLGDYIPLATALWP